MTNIDPVLKRMRRKMDIVRLDTKSRQDPIYHDMNELLSLLDILERSINQERKDDSGKHE